MTEPLDVTKLLAIALYKLGEPLEISEALYNSMMPVSIVLDNEYGSIKLSIKSAELLIGKVDNDEVEVIV